MKKYVIRIFIISIFIVNILCSLCYADVVNYSDITMPNYRSPTPNRPKIEIEPINYKPYIVIGSLIVVVLVFLSIVILVSIVKRKSKKESKNNEEN